MGRSVNKVTLLGNVGSEPEIQSVSSGQRVAKISLATSRTWKDKAGEQHEKTEWHRLVVWGKLVDVVEGFVKKGNPLYVEGEIQYRSYEDKDGTTKYSTDINVQELVLLGGGGDRTESSPRREKKPAAKGGKMDYAKMFPEGDDDLPW